MEEKENLIKKLKEYRRKVDIYSKNKEAFERQAITVEDNVAYIQPLNNFEEHLENRKMLLMPDNKGSVTVKIILTMLGIIVLGVLITFLIGRP